MTLGTQSRLELGILDGILEFIVKSPFASESDGKREVNLMRKGTNARCIRTVYSVSRNHY